MRSGVFFCTRIQRITWELQRLCIDDDQQAHSGESHLITSWATLGAGNIPLLIHSMPSGNGWQIGVSNPSGKTDVQFEAEVVYATFA